MEESRNLPKIRVHNSSESGSIKSSVGSLNSIIGGGTSNALITGNGQSNEIANKRNLPLNRKLSLNTQFLDTKDKKSIHRKLSLAESSPMKLDSAAQHQYLLPSMANHRGSIQSNSSSSKAKQFKTRASELIIRVPGRQLKRIAQTKGISSLQRETQHFVGITSINGLLRIYRSKGVFRLCWIFVTSLSFSFLLWQICKLTSLYQSRPTVSQVSFLLPENGLPFPAVTICSHNPIRQAYVESVNKTGRFSRNLLDYVMYSFMDPQYLLSVKNPMELELFDEEWKAFLQYSEHKFTVNGFFWNASRSCREMLKYCSFGGREFDCCQYAKGILTDIGKCYQFFFGDTDQGWMKRQVQAGVNNGLQIIADAHTEEQSSTVAAAASSSGSGSGHAFADTFENGFRYYVHDKHAMPYLSTEGISVSPGTKIYSAISPTRYYLLSQDEWGNCTRQWPKELQGIVTDGIGAMTVEENLSYTALKCKTLCLAKHFYDHCGCSPFIYNIEEFYQVCSPYETYMCLNNTIAAASQRAAAQPIVNSVDKVADTGDGNNGGGVDAEAATGGNAANNITNGLIEMPTCAECKIECHRSVYHIYNSYSQGFARPFLAWLRDRNEFWTPGHVRSNFVSINIFFRDMSYTEYKQVQSVTMTEILSDIGGNMGLFMGMSLISLTEFCTFICKITWLFISRKRREHMLAKKRRDEEREKRLQATLDFAAHQKKFGLGIGRMMSQVVAAPSLIASDIGGGERRNSLGANAFERLRKITRSMRRKATSGSGKIAPMNTDNGNQSYMVDLENGGVGSNLPNARRSNSIIANLFGANRRGSATSVASTGSKQQHRKSHGDFVESVIASRIHGDAGRAARKSCSSSASSCSVSSTSSSSSSSSNSDVDETESGDKIVELKIDLDALGQGNSRKTVAMLKPVYRRKSAYAMRSVQPPEKKQNGCRRASTFASPKAMFDARNRRRSSLEPSPSQVETLPQQLEPTMGQMKPPAIDNVKESTPNRRLSIAATMSAFISGNSRKESNVDGQEVPNLSRIAQKHSLAAQSRIPVSRANSHQ